MFFNELETKRLYLRNISYDDDEFMLKQFSDPFVSKYLFDEEPFSDISEARGIIDFYTCDEPRSQHRWILVLKSNGEKIGTCGFHCWDRDNGIVEVGYDMQECYQGKGYMHEALTAILDFANANMNLKMVNAVIYPENERSVNAAKNLGFIKSGNTVSYTFRGEEYIHDVYSLTINKK